MRMGGRDRGEHSRWNRCPPIRLRSCRGVGVAGHPYHAIPIGKYNQRPWHQFFFALPDITIRLPAEGNLSYRHQTRFWFR